MCKHAYVTMCLYLTMKRCVWICMSQCCLSESTVVLKTVTVPLPRCTYGLFLPLFGCHCPLFHSSVRASLCLTDWHNVRQSACLCVSVCCLLSVYWVSHQTALGSAKVVESSFSEIVSRQAHTNLLSVCIVTHTHTPMDIYVHTNRGATTKTSADKKTIRSAIVSLLRFLNTPKDIFLLLGEWQQWSGIVCYIESVQRCTTATHKNKKTKWHL